MAGVNFAMPFPYLARAQSMPDPYTGSLYVMVSATGGWDVTSFCDPKLNVPGQPVINNWAKTGNIQKAGNISYAPFAGNQAFFDKYSSYMLVVNGIDAQTNAHSAGVTHNWSGRLSAGMPSFPALVASIRVPGLAMSDISNGAYAETAGLIRFTRFDNPFPLRNVLAPNVPGGSGDDTWLRTADMDAVIQAQAERMAALGKEVKLLPRQQSNRDNYLQSVENTAGFDEFLKLIPADDELQPDTDSNGNFSPFKRQAQLLLLAFKSGVAMTADMAHFEYDTHSMHDTRQATALTALTEGVDYLFTFAEELGLADRLVVYIASDFSRTPSYNDGQGKDHWPIGSAIFMQKNAPWGNRVVGSTSEGHTAYKINPATLKRDDTNGVTILPRNLMGALRSLAGIENDPISLMFPLKNTETIDFFNPSLMTAQTEFDPRHSWRFA